MSLPVIGAVIFALLVTTGGSPYRTVTTARLLLELTGPSVQGLPAGSDADSSDSE